MLPLWRENLFAKETFALERMESWRMEDVSIPTGSLDSPVSLLVSELPRKAVVRPQRPCGNSKSPLPHRGN